nr:uncharacterized protein LOC103787009 [Pan paniscus]XP_054961112.1 uncharacterized protein LOC103787009 [Pan paniscus]
MATATLPATSQNQAMCHMATATLPATSQNQAVCHMATATLPAASQNQAVCHMATATLPAASQNQAVCHMATATLPAASQNQAVCHMATATLPAASQNQAVCHMATATLPAASQNQAVCHMATATLPAASQNQAVCHMATATLPAASQNQAVCHMATATLPAASQNQAMCHMTWQWPPCPLLLRTRLCVTWQRPPCPPLLRTRPCVTWQRPPCPPLLRTRPCVTWQQPPCPLLLRTRPEQGNAAAAVWSWGSRHPGLGGGAWGLSGLAPHCAVSRLGPSCNSNCLGAAHSVHWDTAKNQANPVLLELPFQWQETEETKQRSAPNPTADGESAPEKNRPGRGAWRPGRKGSCVLSRVVPGSLTERMISGQRLKARGSAARGDLWGPSQARGVTRAKSPHGGQPGLRRSSREAMWREGFAFCITETAVGTQKRAVMFPACWHQGQGQPRATSAPCTSQREGSSTRFWLTWVYRATFI